MQKLRKSYEYQLALGLLAKKFRTMPQFLLRPRMLRPLDQLLVFILCVNCVYVMYHIASPSTRELMPVTAQNHHIGLREATYITAETSTAPTVTVTNRRICPQDPPNLLGSLACDCGNTTVQYLVSNYKHIEPGGRIRPRDCQPKERTAIVIPYRDRFEHLHSLLRMLIPILTRQQVDVTIFVIEQTNTSLFNRAALHNIGFLEAQKRARFDCVIFHDVDLVPVNGHILYRCSDQNPRHLAVSIKLGHWVPTKVMPEKYVGGVMCFTAKQYVAINGNSNLYFGFGSENEELYHRIINKNLTVERPDAQTATYHMLYHEKQQIILSYHERVKILKSCERRQDVEGLNSSTYTIHETRIERLYTWVTVSLHLERVLKTAPMYTLLDIKEAVVKEAVVNETVTETMVTDGNT